MQKLKRGMVLLLIVLLFCLGLVCGVKLSGLFSVSSPARRYDTAVLLKQVQSLSELVTVKYVMEKTEVWDDPPQNVLAQFFSGDNHILLLAHGIVKAGVDLSRLKPEDLHVQGTTVTIKLPPADITDAYLDDTQTKVVERKTGFLRTFDKDLEQNIRSVAIEDIRNAAGRGGIREEADKRARAVLTSLFHQLGFEKVEFQTR
jgi:hypothetical protein